VIRVDDQVSKELRALMARVGNVDPALDEIGGSQVAEVQTRFEGERGPDGAGWVGLSKHTLKKKRGPSILRERGGLFASQTHEVSGGQVAIGTNSPIAGIHHFGGQAGRNLAVTIPARPFLGLSEDGKAEILAILREHVEAA